MPAVSAGCHSQEAGAKMRQNDKANKKLELYTRLGGDHVDAKAGATAAADD